MPSNVTKKHSRNLRQFETIIIGSTVGDRCNCCMKRDTTSVAFAAWHKQQAKVDVHLDGSGNTLARRQLNHSSSEKQLSDDQQILQVVYKQQQSQTFKYLFYVDGKKRFLKTAEICCYSLNFGACRIRHKLTTV